jgi:hypothetical protein
MMQNEVTMTGSSITMHVLRGNEAIPYLQDLAKLRISFYRNYPYLYEGTLTGEENYLNMYANSENSLLAVAKKGQEVVGAIAGIALSETQEMHKKQWIQQKIPADNVFYLGEMVLLHEYLKSDLQEKLYQVFEQAVRGLKRYDSMVVCEIERDPKDSKRPANSLSSEVRWDGRGFVRQPALNTYYSWKEIGDLKDTDHLMGFWSKELKK